MKINGAVSFLALLAAFDSGTPGWKMDGDKIATKDGHPIYVDSSGREMTVGGDTISNLQKEAMTNRQERETAEKKLKAFEGVDPEQARKDRETVVKLDGKKLIDTGEVDKLTQQIKDQFATQMAEKDKALNDANSRMDNMLIDQVFNGSDFVRENVAVPQDMFKSYFRNNFKVEDGKVVAYGKDGNKLLSKSRAGEYADVGEAMELLVEQHPQKDVILKANVGSGTGSDGGGGKRPGGRVIKRADFDKLPPVQQQEISQKMGRGEMEVVD